MKICLCDDDRVWLQQAARILNMYFELRCETVTIISLDNSDELERVLKKQHMDVLFLDIDLGKRDNGIEIAKQINQYSNIKIIFVSNYLNYALEAYEAEHTYFMTKEKFVEKLPRMFEKIRRDEQESERKVALEVGNRDVRIFFEKDIYYIEKQGHIANIHTAHGVLVTKEKLDDVKQRLRPGSYLRCHTSFIIMLHAVAKLTKDEFVLNTGEAIKTSRKYRKEAKDGFAEWVQKQIS